MEKICTIIVTYNPNLTDFSTVLDSHTQSGDNEVIVVDNGSHNNAEILKIVDAKKFSLISLQENMGIGYAQNIGIKAAKIKGCKYIILFDQDTIITPNYAESILQYYKEISQNEKVATIGPNYYDPNTNRIYPQIVLDGIKLNKIFPKPEDGDFTFASFIIASGSFYDIDIFDEVGVMDEKLFIDCVDIEWCFRALQKGYKTYVCNKLMISHTIGDQRKKSLGREISIHAPIRKYYMARNNILLIRKKSIPFSYKVRKLFGIPLYMSLYLYDVGFAKEYVKFIFKGLKDGIIGKDGKYEQ